MAQFSKNNWRVLEPLDEAECMELLAGARQGRLVYTSRYGPTALPVTYVIDARGVIRAQLQAEGPSGVPEHALEEAVLPLLGQLKPRG